MVCRGLLSQILQVPFWADMQDTGYEVVIFYLKYPVTKQISSKGALEEFIILRFFVFLKLIKKQKKSHNT